MWTDTLVDWVAAECSATRVVLRSPGIDPAAVPDGAVAFDGDPCRAHPVLRMRVGDRQFTLRPVLDVFVEAPVATAPAAVGTEVAWTLAPVRLGSWSGASVPAGQWVATATLKEGVVLTSLVVAPRPDVVAGTVVALSVRSGDLEIKSDARLLRDARVGEQVRVFVPATNRVVVGRLVDATTVAL
jgi:hypothetical protein